MLQHIPLEIEFGEQKGKERNMKIGKIVKKEDYTKAAIWCNKNNAHIELFGGKYVIVANPAKPEPTLEEIVAKLEAETGLTRVMREMILAENSGASDYIKVKAQEIENLAKQLRETEDNKTEKTNETNIGGGSEW